MVGFKYFPTLFGDSSLMRALHTSSSGANVQTKRLDVVAQNLANMYSTGLNPGDDPYTRKTISFRNQLDRKSGVHRVIVDKIGKDKTPFVEEYDPSHPASNESGYVKKPNVNRHVEIRDMQEAMRAHHVNLSMIKVLRDMMEKLIAVIAR